MSPTSVALKTLYAAACVGLGEHERADRAVPRAAHRRPAGCRGVPVDRPCARRPSGTRRRRSQSYRQAAACRADFGDAYWSLANLKTYRFTDAELAQHARGRWRRRRPRSTDRYHLCFALGKALEDRGDFAESFRYYQLGNELKRPECRYRAELIETNTQQQIQVCTRGVLRRAAAAGATRAADPIFIVGLPRSGSTLLEQILASHSQVEGTQELPERAADRQPPARLRARDRASRATRASSRA